MGVARHYLKAWSHALGRDMEILRFGDTGRPILAFPTSLGRFYQWEDFGMVEALHDRLEGGHIQLWCVDGIDEETWYARHRPPWERVQRHLDYERYVVDEVLPHLSDAPVSAGPSFGGFHALLTVLRHPSRFAGFVVLAGAFDTDRWLDGHSDEQTYMTNPPAFLPDLWDEAYLGPLRAMGTKVIATGTDDPNRAESEHVAGLLRDKGIDVWLDLVPGWNHDWPYWKEMIRRYV
jgi:esterase/lipase superfamily enzyme